MNYLDIVTLVLCLLGGFFIIVAAVGLIRLPDVYCRAHALGKAMTLGLCSILMALWIHLGIDEAGLVLPLAILCQLLTIPVASHLLARMAYRRGLRSHQPGSPDTPKR